VDSNAYTYDPLGTGDVVGRPADGSSRPAAQTLAWDSSGNLAAVTAADGSKVTFVRDALDRVRERVQTDATTAHAVTADTVYRFSGNGDSPSYELDQLHGGTMKSFLDGAAIVYAGNRSGTPTFLFSDVHGNTVATADQNANATGTIATYDPFGAPLATNAANPTSFGFVGSHEKYTDPFANLVLMGARPYDPALGRFLAVDPVQHGSANDYDYTNQDPINGYDLSGNAPWDGWCFHNPFGGNDGCRPLVVDVVNSGAFHAANSFANGFTGGLAGWAEGRLGADPGKQGGLFGVLGTLASLALGGAEAKFLSTTVAGAGRANGFLRSLGLGRGWFGGRLGLHAPHSVGARTLRNLDRHAPWWHVHIGRSRTPYSLGGRRFGR
jgi:RHS repeat-associated protein